MFKQQFMKLKVNSFLSLPVKIQYFFIAYWSYLTKKILLAPFCCTENEKYLLETVENYYTRLSFFSELFAWVEISSEDPDSYFFPNGELKSVLHMILWNSVQDPRLKDTSQVLEAWTLIFERCCGHVEHCHMSKQFCCFITLPLYLTTFIFIHFVL